MSKILNSMISGRFNNREVIEVMYNGEIIWCNNIYEIHATEYIVSSDSSYLLSDINPLTNSYYALPKFTLLDGSVIVPGLDSNYPVTILLKDGNDTNDINTPLSNIEKITIHYNGNVSSISFANNTEITEIAFGKTDNLNNVVNMFKNCTKLKTLKIPNFTTDGITSMNGMFYNCSSLTSLDLSKFNTSSVTDMGYMFYGCSSLTSLNISNWDTTSVVISLNMFYSVPDAIWIYDFYDYEKVNLKESITGFNYKFPWNYDLIYTIDTTSGLTFGSYVEDSISGKIYVHKPKLSYDNDMTIKIVRNDGRIATPKSNTSVSDIKYVLVMSDNIDRIDFSDTKIRGLLKTNDITLLNESSTGLYVCPLRFSDCTSLTSVDLSNINTSNVITMRNMFSGCSSLEEIRGLENFDTINVTDMSYMFGSCSSLTSLDLSSFNTSKVTDMSSMFYNCTRLTTLDLSSFNTSIVTNMEALFSSCSSLTTLDLSAFNTIRVTDMSSMFSSCTRLTTLDLSSFNTSKVTDMGHMFNGCTRLTTLDLSSFNTSNVTNHSSIFSTSMTTDVYVSDENFTLTFDSYYKINIIRV